jgi:hypothetical protein
LRVVPVPLTVITAADFEAYFWIVIVDVSRESI